MNGNIVVVAGGSLKSGYWEKVKICWISCFIWCCVSFCSLVVFFYCVLSSTTRACMHTHTHTGFESFVFNTYGKFMTAYSHKTNVVISQCQIFDLVITATCPSQSVTHTNSFLSRRTLHQIPLISERKVFVNYHHCSTFLKQQPIRLSVRLYLSTQIFLPLFPSKSPTFIKMVIIGSMYSIWCLTLGRQFQLFIYLFYINIINKLLWKLDYRKKNIFCNRQWPLNMLLIEIIYLKFNPCTESIIYYFWVFNVCFAIFKTIVWSSLIYDPENNIWMNMN